MLASKEFNSSNWFDKSERKRKENRIKARKRILYCLLVFIPLCTYGAKHTFFAIGNQGTLGILALFLLPLICLPLIAAIVSEILFVVYGLNRHDWIPALGFVLLLLIAIFLPLLPLPPSETEQHFYDHRGQYEATVDLARKGQLPKDAYAHAQVEKQHPLVVLFNPYDDFYTYIAYADRRDDLHGTDACSYDGSIHSQIGATWWLCFREWN